jgi:hypothetical protein
MDFSQIALHKLTSTIGGCLIAYGTDEAERVEGMNSGDKTTEPLPRNVAEGKSVGEDIFQGIAYS